MIPITLTSPEPIDGIRVGYSMLCRLYNGDQSGRVVADSSEFTQVVNGQRDVGLLRHLAGCRGRRVEMPEIVPAVAE